MEKFRVALATPANEMAQEEILKYVGYLSRNSSDPSFTCDDASIEVRAPEVERDALIPKIQQFGDRTAKALHHLERKCVFKSVAAATPAFAESVAY